MIATLESDGYAVVAASDGAQALRMFPQEKFDLVLLDLAMPVLAGERINYKAIVLLVLAVGALLFAAIAYGYDWVESVAGSTHGYDGTDPTRVSAERGGETGLRSLAEHGARLARYTPPFTFTSFFAMRPPRQVAEEHAQRPGVAVQVHSRAYHQGIDDQGHESAPTAPVSGHAWASGENPECLSPAPLTINPGGVYFRPEGPAWIGGYSPPQARRWRGPSATRPSALRPFLRVWKISEPICTAWAMDSAPTGRIMNSCMSIGLSAWAPPLMMFIIGTGRRRAFGPPI